MISTVSDAARRLIMSNIVTVTQISLAVIQYCIAAALVGAAARIPFRTTASVSAKGRVKP
jgi:hypothetical protein